jgi:hypothetical protein
LDIRWLGHHNTFADRLAVALAPPGATPYQFQGVPDTHDPIPSGSPLERAIGKGFDWLSKVVHPGDGGMPQPVLALETVGDRSEASRRGIRMTPNADAKTVVHETGHFMGYSLKLGNDNVNDRDQEFLSYRVGNETLTNLRQRFGNLYRANEFGREDHFTRYWLENSAYYVGKDYGPDATEILSMGLDSLYTNPVEFAAKDPEFAKYVLGILDGSLR